MPEAIIRRIGFSVALTLFLCLVVVGSCAKHGQIAGPLPQSIYIWQRVWNEQVEAALTDAKESVRGFGVLAAEIDLREGEPKVFRPNVNYAAIKASGLPIALAIRIDPFSGPFAADDRNARAIVDLVRATLITAQKKHIELSELQIDFDCGEGKLDGYRIWLRQIRAAAAPLPVTPTMLPSWLKHRAFQTLARESGSFILQVHSVGVPQSIQDTQTLCDPRQTRLWVDQAALLGVPFRVSLPTYSYLIAFDSAGKLSGISAEGPSARWPATARIVRWEADAAQMSELVAEWNRVHPREMTGIYWYRLPVIGDALNWNWHTLRMVMAGERLRSAVHITTSNSQPTEIVAVNEGDLDERLPKRIEARWSDARLVAADALEDYALTKGTVANDLLFQLNSAGEVLRLPPGARHTVGWVRCEPSTGIHASVVSDSSLPVDAAPVDARDRH